MASLPPQRSQPQPSLVPLTRSSLPADNEVGQGAAQVQYGSDSEDNVAHPTFIKNVSNQTTSDATAAADAATHTSTPMPEPRHCWICLQNEDEEGSNNLAWRSPCPCKLQAHEQCMLDWIADLESQRSQGGGQSGETQNKILCPQCLAEIRVETPRDIVVLTVDLLIKTGRILVFPAGTCALGGCLYSGSLIYGLNSLYLVFGNDYVEELIRRQSEEIPLVRRLIGDGVYSFLLKVTAYIDPFMPMSNLLSPEMYVGLPLVGPALVLSRFNRVNYIFPILPIPLLAFALFFDPEPFVQHWPPRPSVAITVLPYIRAAYNELYRRSFSKLEKSWEQAMLRNPREGETIEQVAMEQEEPVVEGGGLRVEVNFDFDFGRGVEEDPEEERHAEEVPVVDDRVAAQIPAVEAPQERQDNAQPNVNVNEGEQQPNRAPAPPLNANGRQLADPVINVLDLGSNIMGALFFPAVSSLMGNLLKYTLPKTWVTRPVAIFADEVVKALPATGLLQEKWGRSFVGGCLFVVLKDALILYVKWKRARNHRLRKILDYVPKK